MTHADKRSVTTDALETLGYVIDSEQKRDAIHLAVEPVVAGETLYPGQDIGFNEDGEATHRNADKFLGIVDPFLKRRVEPGDRFWLVVYPRKITSLRHVWTHPDFPKTGDLMDVEQCTKKATAERTDTEDAMRWIANYAGTLGLTYDALMDAALAYLDDDKYLCEGSRYEGESLPEGFWSHFEIITRRNVRESQRHSFFSCSC